MSEFDHWLMDATPHPTDRDFIGGELVKAERRRLALPTATWSAGRFMFLSPRLSASHAGGLRVDHTVTAAHIPDWGPNTSRESTHR